MERIDQAIMSTEGRYATFWLSSGSEISGKVSSISVFNAGDTKAERPRLLTLIDAYHDPNTVVYIDAICIAAVLITKNEEEESTK